MNGPGTIFVCPECHGTRSECRCKEVERFKSELKRRAAKPDLPWAPFLDPIAAELLAALAGLVESSSLFRRQALELLSEATPLCEQLRERIETANVLIGKHARVNTDTAKTTQELEAKVAELSQKIKTEEQAKHKGELSRIKGERDAAIATIEIFRQSGEEVAKQRDRAQTERDELRTKVEVQKRVLKRIGAALEALREPEPKPCAACGMPAGKGALTMLGSKTFPLCDDCDAAWFKGGQDQMRIRTAVQRKL